MRVSTKTHCHFVLSFVFYEWLAFVLVVLLLASHLIPDWNCEFSFVSNIYIAGSCLGLSRSSLGSLAFLCCGRVLWWVLPDTPDLSMDRKALELHSIVQDRVRNTRNKRLCRKYFLHLITTWYLVPVRMTLLPVEMLRLLQVGCSQVWRWRTERDNNICEWEWPWYCHTDTT